MLSIHYPHLMSHLQLFRYGLMPIITPEGEHFLIIKATKEGILAAREKNGFRVYLLSENPEQSLLGHRILRRQ